MSTRRKQSKSHPQVYKLIIKLDINNEKKNTIDCLPGEIVCNVFSKYQSSVGSPAICKSKTTHLIFFLPIFRFEGNSDMDRVLLRGHDMVVSACV